MDYLLLTNALRLPTHWWCFVGRLLALQNHAYPDNNLSLKHTHVHTNTHSQKMAPRRTPPRHTHTQIWGIALDICVKYWMKRYFSSFAKGTQPLKMNGNKRFCHFLSDPDSYHLDNYVMEDKYLTRSRAFTNPSEPRPQRSTLKAVIAQQGSSHNALSVCVCVEKQESKTVCLYISVYQYILCFFSHYLLLWKPRLWHVV